MHNGPDTAVIKHVEILLETCTLETLAIICSLRPTQNPWRITKALLWLYLELIWFEISAPAEQHNEMMFSHCQRQALYCKAEGLQRSPVPCVKCNRRLCLSTGPWIGKSSCTLEVTIKFNGLICFVMLLKVLECMAFSVLTCSVGVQRYNSSVSADWLAHMNLRRVLHAWKKQFYKSLLKVPRMCLDIF